MCSRLAERFTPYQIILSTLTAVYALRNLDTILGFHGMSLLFDLPPRLN